MRYRVDRISKEAFIQFLLKEEALRFGNFTLKSGITSPFFINLGDIHSGEALKFVGRSLAENIHENFGEVDIVFGPPYKGISLASAVAMMYSEIYQKNISLLYNRKEAKGHGEKGMFVGRLPQKNDCVVVIDDVISTGGAKLEAIQILHEAFAVQAAGIVVTVDRRRKGMDSGLGDYRLHSIINITDIIQYLENKNSAQAALMKKFYEGE